MGMSTADLPKMTLVLSTYKQYKIIDANLYNLRNQTLKPHEIIITNDNIEPELNELVEKYSDDFKIILIQNEDKGFRKCMCLNMAVKASSGDALIFNDGDCMPHSRFVEQHAKLIEKGRVLCGRRVMFGDHFIEPLLQQKIQLKEIEDSYVSSLFTHLFTAKTDYFEEGFFIDPESFLGKLMPPRKIRDIIGCNFSIFKEDLYKINGFDEDFVLPTIGEDNDLTWRLQHFGIEIKSARNAAITYHLGKHIYEKDSESVINNRKMMAEKKAKGLYRCVNGLEKLEVQ